MKRISYLTAQLKHSQRLLTTNARPAATPSFSPGPAPPRLPEEDQKIYERLQQSSTGAFSTPKPTVIINQSPASASSTTEAQAHVPPVVNQSSHTESTSTLSSEQKLENINAKVTAQGDGEELHPHVRRGAKPEFEGDKNPKTGEVGGPKNDPLRWGGEVDWSYNGRVTDF